MSERLTFRLRILASLAKMSPFFSVRKRSLVGLSVGAVVCLITGLQLSFPAETASLTDMPETLKKSAYPSEITAADSLFRSGLFDLALTRYKSIEQELADNQSVPRNDLAWLWLKIARAYVQSDQPEMANATLDSVMLRSPESQWTAMAYIERGKLKQTLGQYKEAVALYNKGITAQSGPVSADAAFRLAYCYHKLKNYSAAVSWYDKASPGLSGIEDYPLFLSAECLIELKLPDQAISRMTEIYKNVPHSLYRNRAIDLHLENLISNGNFDDAISQARGRLADEHFLNGDDKAALWKHIADAHFYSARLDSARALYNRILDTFVTTPAAAKVVPRLEQIAAIAGTPLTPKEKLHVGRAYLEQQEYGQATQVLLALSKAPKNLDITPQALYYLNRARFLQKLNLTAEAGFQDIVTQFPSHPIAGSASFHIARCIRARKGALASVNAYLAFATAYPADENAADALFFAGSQMQEAKRLSEAARYFHLVAQQYPNYEKQDDARWLEGFSNYRIRKYELAAQAFETQATEDSTSVYAPKSLYWAGKAYEMTSQREKAVHAYDRTLSGYPGSYYAYLSTKNLNRIADRPIVRALTGRGLADPPADQTRFKERSQWVSRFDSLMGEGKDNIESEHLKRAEILMSLGLTEEGEAELQHFSTANENSPVALKRTVSLYYRYNQYRQGIRAAGRLEQALTRIGRRDLAPKAFLYPYPFWETVKREAASNKLDPLLVLSVMRQESRFEFNIKSWAGAHGLMQLMPMTAKGLAQQRKLARPTTDRLYEPAYNINMGTWYLADLLRSFKGQLEPALAAYNCGPGRVSRWLKDSANSDMDDFVENIPFTETRGYVKAVMNNYAQYSTQDAEMLE